MTRDDIIEILEWHPSHVEHGASGLLSRIERVVAVAVAREREACATFLERGVDLGGLAEHPGWQRYSADLLTGCAAAIRARKENT